MAWTSDSPTMPVKPITSMAARQPNPVITTQPPSRGRGLLEMPPTLNGSSVHGRRPRDPSILGDRETLVGAYVELLTRDPILHTDASRENHQRLGAVLACGELVLRTPDGAGESVAADQSVVAA